MKSSDTTELFYDTVNQRIAKALSEGGPSSVQVITGSFPSLQRVKDLKERLARLQGAGLIRSDEQRGSMVYRLTERGKDEYLRLPSKDAD